MLTWVTGEPMTGPCLPRGIQRLALQAHDVETIGFAQDLLENVDWDITAQTLDTFSLQVTEVGPVRFDLGFLRLLRNLEAIGIQGVEHGGQGASPIRPPFSGLSRRLTQVSIEAQASERDHVKTALYESLGADAYIRVYRTQEPDVSAGASDW